MSDASDMSSVQDVTKRPAKRVAIVATLASSLVNFRGPLISEMRARGHEVLCFAPEFDHDTRSRLSELGVFCQDIPLQRTGLNPLTDIQTIRELTRLFKGYAPDVFLGYTPKAAIYGTIAAARAGVPVRVPMITGLGYAFLDEGVVDRRKRRIRSIMIRLYSYALRRATRVIFHNKDDAKVLKDLGGVPKNTSVVIVDGSGVDLTRFNSLPLPDMSGGISFLLVARLVRYKGVQEFCEAARLVTEAGHQARFVLVGPSESGPAGISSRLLSNYSHIVAVEGGQPNVVPYLEQCHVYALPSYGEGLPRTVLEAMAVGRPIITTDTRGCRETVDEMVNGILVPPRESHALANAMVRLIEHKDLLPSLGLASREKVERRFDVRRINADMLQHLTLD